MSKKLDTQLVSNNADKTQLHKTQRHCGKREVKFQNPMDRRAMYNNAARV